MRMEQQYI